MDLEDYLAMAQGLAADGKAEHDLDAARRAKISAMRALARSRREASQPRVGLSERLKAVPRPTETTLRRVRLQGAPFSETVWAEVRPDGKTVLASVPMITPDLGVGDVLRISEPDAPWKAAVVRGVEERGRLSTIVVSKNGEDDATAAALVAVCSLAVAVERKQTIVALAVPVERQVEAERLLDAGEWMGLWSYAVMADRATAAA